jgi:hypothetical protein
MTMMSGQTDGPSQPTNRQAEPSVASTSSTGQPQSPVLHWLRDFVLATPAVLLALVLVGGLVRGRRASAAAVGAARAVTVSGALALASPAHGVLFGEGVAGLREMARVFLLALPFTAGALLAVAALHGVVRALAVFDPEGLRRRIAIPVRSPTSCRPSRSPSR